MRISQIIEVNPARYDARYIIECIKKFTGNKGEITARDIPKISPLNLHIIGCPVPCSTTR